MGKYPLCWPGKRARVHWAAKAHRCNSIRPSSIHQAGVSSAWLPGVPETVVWVLVGAGVWGTAQCRWKGEENEKSWEWVGCGGVSETVRDRWMPFCRTPVSDGASEQWGVISWMKSRHSLEVSRNSEDIFEPLSRHFWAELLATDPYCYIPVSDMSFCYWRELVSIVTDTSLDFC